MAEAIRTSTIVNPEVSLTLVKVRILQKVYYDL